MCYPSVWVECEEPGLLLLILHQTDRVKRVRDWRSCSDELCTHGSPHRISSLGLGSGPARAELLTLKGDIDLEAVWGVGRVELNELLTLRGLGRHAAREGVLGEGKGRAGARGEGR